jgi:signal transduction histidine kinase
VRNPLMIIKGSLRSLTKDGVAAEVREAAADIDHEVARLDRVVGDVLDFARPLRLERAPVDVHALVRDAACATLGGAGGVSARFALEPSAATIVTDGERLRGVLVNLIANARESLAAASGSNGAEIEVGARGLDRGGVVLWVADRGPGIPSVDLPHVFEPYFTTKRTGTGLGLAISRKVVEALGGTIRIESREREGTRVEVELPAEAKAETEVR